MCQIDSADKYETMSSLHCWIRSYLGGEKAKRQSWYRTSDSVHRKTKARLKTRPLLKKLDLVLGVDL